MDKATLSWNTTLTEARWADVAAASKTAFEKKVLQPMLAIDNSAPKIGQVLKEPKSVNIKHLYRIWTQEKATDAAPAPVSTVEKTKDEALAKLTKYKPPWQASTNPNSAIATPFNYQRKPDQSKEPPRVRISSAKPLPPRLSVTRNKSDFISPYLGAARREPRQSLQTPMLPITRSPKKQNFVIKKVNTIELVFSPLCALTTPGSQSRPRLSRGNTENLRP